MIFEGKNFMDIRGNLNAINDFNFLNIKRFYHITNHKNNTIRAWHAHKNETKYFYVSSGKFMLGSVNLENNEIKKYFLNSNIPQIVKISANHANGFMNLTKDSSIIVFSDKTLEESLDDDIRYPYDKWDIWKIEHF